MLAEIETFLAAEIVGATSQLMLLTAAATLVWKSAGNGM
jgi:hypothetical protein